MAIDTTQPESPGWWLQWLLNKRQREWPRYSKLNRYYEGTNGIPVHADEAVKEAFSRLMRVARTNWAALSVEAALERMRPTGFRTGAADDRLGDKEAWRVWQANGLDLGAPQVFEASLSMSTAYMIVGDLNPDTGVPLITPEDPREVVVETDPTNRRKVRAGLKVFRDYVAGADIAYLYLPGQVWKAMAPVTSRHPDPGADAGTESPVTASAWEWDDARVLPSGVMPVVPFPCNPRMDGTGRGCFENHLPLLDRINYLVLNQLEIVTLQAFRQRAINVEEDVDEHGNEIDWDDLLEAGPGAIWKLPATAKIWESGLVDLGALVNVCREPVKDFAAVSGTPLYYLVPEASDGSAEGAALARERLLYRVDRYIANTTESLEDVQATAFRIMGDEERAHRPAMQVIWDAPERWTLAQMADADQKAANGGSLTLRKRRELIYGLTPQEIEEMEAEDVREALRQQGAELTRDAIRADDTGRDEPAG